LISLLSLLESRLIMEKYANTVKASNSWQT
jgi:hypothetical protein